MERRMDKVRCGVIGAGWWGTMAHVPALKRHPHAELVAVQGRDLPVIRKVATDFGVPHAYDSVNELLATPGLAAVVISSTPHLHYAQAKAALERGLHVLLEKPMTFRAEEARELVALAKSRGVQLLISGPWHYTTHAAEAQRLVRSGAIGRVKMISILMTNFTLGLYQGVPWEKLFSNNDNLQNAAKPYLEPGQHSYSDPAIAGGGQIYCQVSHPAAYVAFLTGRRPAEVFARFDNAGTDVDVYDSLSIKLDDGTLVSLASTGATMLSERNYELRLYGTEGMILMELWKGQMEFHDLKSKVTRYPALAESDVYPMFAPAENLIDIVRGAAPNRSPGELGLFAIEVAEAAGESARTGRNVIARASRP
jgi:predicted dehydrogenase